MRASLDEVTRDRDLLRGRVKSVEKLVHQQIGRSYPSADMSRPSSAPHTARGSSSDRRRSPEGQRQGGAQTARALAGWKPPKMPATIGEEKEKEMMKRLYDNPKVWKAKSGMLRKDGTQIKGVEQLKQKLEAEDRRQRMLIKENVEKSKEAEMARAHKRPARKKDPPTKEDLEKAAEDMFNRAKTARDKLDRMIAQRQEAQVPTHKKSASTGIERMMRFQRLSMPVTKVQPQVKWTPRGVSASASAGSLGAKGGAKPAWFAGSARAEEEKKAWTAGETLGVNARRSAVH